MAFLLQNRRFKREASFFSKFRKPYKLIVMELKEDNTQNNAQNTPTPEVKKKSNRGFASMDPERQRAIARKGGETVSQNREHMATIGAKGGERVSQNREHMAAIGRKGGESSGLNRANASKNKEDRRGDR
jgi:general stress protein YciG